MRNAMIAGGAVLLLAVLAAVFGMRAHESAVDELQAKYDAQEQALDEQRTKAEGLAAELASERRRARQTDEQAANLKTELTKVRAELEERAAAAAVEPASETLGWRDVVRLYPAFRPEGLGDALAEVDWEVVADSMSHMPPLIAELSGALQEGRALTDLPPETIGSIQRYNGPLVTTAMRLAQGGVVGTDVNGAFSHPGFMTNAIAATLVALEMPLDAQQTAKLAHVAADYSARENQRVAGYDDSAFVLEKLVDESKLKHDYFQEVYAILTEEQHAALRPEAVRGRTQLDIFCEGLMWAGRAGPMVVSDRDDLSTKAAAWVISRGNVPESAQERTREIVGAWVADLPAAFLAWEADSLVQAGMLQVDHCTDSAARVLGLLRTLQAELALDDEHRAKLRAVPGSIVMYREAADGG